jgi:hypothetical protein
VEWGQRNVLMFPSLCADRDYNAFEPNQARTAFRPVKASGGFCWRERNWKLRISPQLTALHAWSTPVVTRASDSKSTSV